MVKPYTITDIRNAQWLMTFAPGTPWLVGSFAHPNREAELVRMGVLVPTDDPALYAVAHVAALDTLPVRKR